MKKIYFLPLVIFVFACWSNSSIDQAAGRTMVNATDTPEKHALPPPHATRSQMNFCKVVGWRSNEMPKAPAGFKVNKFADKLDNPRWIYVLPNGDVLVAETKKEHKGVIKVAGAVTWANKSENDSPNMNRIILFRDNNNDGTPDLQTNFLEGLNLPFGMVLIGNDFFVACTDAVWKYAYKTGETKIGAAGQKILDLPGGARHWTKSMQASKDGKKIYIGVGSASDHAEDGIDKEMRRANILQINVDGSGEKVFAAGLRNPCGMDWEPVSGQLWTVVNERDMLGDDLVPDYLTSVKEDGFYGWPYSYFGQNEDPRIKEKDKRPDLVSKALVPDVELGSHTASLGLRFYDKKLFPNKYHNGAFIGQHGSWNRSVPSGYKVVFVPFNNGIPGTPEDFLTGFMIDENKNEVHGRPVCVTLMNDGSMLVADDAGNTIWRVSYAK